MEFVLVFLSLCVQMKGNQKVRDDLRSQWNVVDGQWTGQRRASRLVGGFCLRQYRINRGQLADSATRQTRENKRVNVAFGNDWFISPALQRVNNSQDWIRLLCERGQLQAQDVNIYHQLGILQMQMLACHSRFLQRSSRCAKLHKLSTHCTP